MRAEPRSRRARRLHPHACFRWQTGISHRGTETTESLPWPDLTFDTGCLNMWARKRANIPAATVAATVAQASALRASVASVPLCENPCSPPGTRHEGSAALSATLRLRAHHRSSPRAPCVTVSHELTEARVCLMISKDVARRAAEPQSAPLAPSCLVPVANRNFRTEAQRPQRHCVGFHQHDSRCNGGDGVLARLRAHKFRQSESKGRSVQSSAFVASVPLCENPCSPPGNRHEGSAALSATLRLRAHHLSSSPRTAFVTSSKNEKPAPDDSGAGSRLTATRATGRGLPRPCASRSCRS